MTEIVATTNNKAFIARYAGGLTRIHLLDSLITEHPLSQLPLNVISLSKTQWKIVHDPNSLARFRKGEIRGYQQLNKRVNVKDFHAFRRVPAKVQFETDSIIIACKDQKSEHVPGIGINDVLALQQNQPNVETLLALLQSISDIESKSVYQLSKSPDNQWQWVIRAKHHP